MIRFCFLEDVISVSVDGEWVGYFDLDVIGDRVVCSFVKGGV